MEPLASCAPAGSAAVEQDQQGFRVEMPDLLLHKDAVGIGHHRVGQRYYASTGFDAPGERLVRDLPGGGFVHFGKGLGAQKELGLAAAAHAQPGGIAGDQAAAIARKHGGGVISLGFGAENFQGRDGQAGRQPRPAPDAARFDDGPTFAHG